MTIKEVEQSIGITKANIRFYEKEGLLEPPRNKENNYREYTNQDVLLLKKIKLLRALDISLPEIHSLITDPDRLSQVLEKRLQTLEDEKQHLQETEDICRRILNENLSFDALSETIIDEQSLRLKDRIALIMTTDMSCCHHISNSCNFDRTHDCHDSQTYYTLHNVPAAHTCTVTGNFVLPQNCLLHTAI